MPIRARHARGFQAVRVQKLNAQAFLLLVGLFALHTFVLFELAAVITRLHATISKPLSAHLADPAIILICFLALFITHLLEAAAWAVFLRKKAPFASFIESLYFSVSSTTALGYGDVVLRPPWRVVGACMAINGLLMFGWSTAFLFLIIQKTWQDML